ncbi:MAG: TonB family protein [Gammaproteobacteria bacterium]|nr:TonB family protein [Gammaproteobacteria bacterium]
MDSGTRLASLFVSIILHAAVLISIPIPLGETNSGPADSSSALHITVEHSKLSDHPSQVQSPQPAMAQPSPQVDTTKLETSKITAQPIQRQPVVDAASVQSSPMVIHTETAPQKVTQHLEPANIKPANAVALEKQPEPVEHEKEEPTPPVHPRAVVATVAASTPTPPTEVKGRKVSVKQPLQTATSGNSKRLSREYRSTLLRLIERNKYYPLRARRRGMGGKALVAFTVKRNGEIRNISLSRSSKQQLLDQAAIQTIKRMGKAPPLPKGISRNHWRFVVPISYNIR